MWSFHIVWSLLKRKIISSGIFKCWHLMPVLQTQRIIIIIRSFWPNCKSSAMLHSFFFFSPQYKTKKDIYQIPTSEWNYWFLFKAGFNQIYFKVTATVNCMPFPLRWLFITAGTKLTPLDIWCRKDKISRNTERITFCLWRFSTESNLKHVRYYAQKFKFSACSVHIPVQKKKSPNLRTSNVFQGCEIHS